MVLVQHVDDLLLAAPTAEACLKATHTFLSLLHSAGFKVRRAKLQCCRREIIFLGRIVTSTGSGLSPTHCSSILHHAKPVTAKDMLSFLGLTGFSRHYFPDDVGLTDPLRQLVRQCWAHNLTASTMC